LIHGLSDSLIIAAADRRISRFPDGTYDSTRRKLFKIPYLKGAISYFGLASVFPNGQRQYLSDWLPNFSTHQSKAQDLKSFANSLRNELNGIVPSNILKQVPSGFHICGYDMRGFPDFWYLSNIGRMQGFAYIKLKPKYASPKSHFLDRDARTKFGWDGVNPLSARNGASVYRNGDFRAHVVAWESLDSIFNQLFQFPDFKPPRTFDQYGEYVKFKFEVIAYLYKKWAKREIIARPIDVLVLRK